MKKLLLLLTLWGMVAVGCSDELDGINNGCEILYTSTSGDIVKPHPSTSRSTFGADILSNRYLNGQGVITFDSQVTTIGKSAFYTAFDLESIIIPSTVTSIGESAFSGCYNLTSVDMPSGLASIGKSAFSGCGGLTSVTIPDRVTTIGDEAFINCRNLTSVDMPSGLVLIGKAAFRDCFGLTSVTIPDRVTAIEGFAFNGCENLASVTIGSSIASIGEYAFNSIENHLCVYCKATTPPSLGYRVFSSINYDYSNVSIYVPTKSVSAYKSAEGWDWYAHRIFGYDFE